MKKFRIATEGATTDGRVISADWIRQMAKNYDPKTYGARVNLEHYRGVLPDGPFKAYGDVVSLSAEVIKDGALAGKLGLYAEIDPTPDLVELSKKRQKVYTSMEVNPKFGDTQEAYLEGLAITDSPASLGPEMLKFAAGAQVNPLAARKRNPDNLFSEAVEIELDFSDVAPKTDDKGLFAKVKEMLGRIGDKAAATDARLSDAHQAVELLADNQSKLTEQLTHLAARTPGEAPAAVTELAAKLEKLSTDFTALVAQLDKEPEKHSHRPTATGGAGANLTDC